jgi:hypothetical protein
MLHPSTARCSVYVPYLTLKVLDAVDKSDLYHFTMMETKKFLMELKNESKLCGQTLRQNSEYLRRSGTATGVLDELDACADCILRMEMEGRSAIILFGSSEVFDQLTMVALSNEFPVDPSEHVGIVDHRIKITARHLIYEGRARSRDDAAVRTPITFDTNIAYKLSVLKILWQQILGGKVIVILLLRL